MHKKDGNILIVDDNESILISLQQLLKYDFEFVKTIKNPNMIPSAMQKTSFDIVLLDMNFMAGVNSGNEGIFWLREILSIDSSVIVILMTAYGDIELAVKAVKEGGTDFIVKPWEPKKLITTLKSAYQLRKSKLEVKELKNKQAVLKQNTNSGTELMLGSSLAMKEVFCTIKKVAKTDANVLIVGENGTGKELVAREIHRQSLRKNEVFIGVDLGSLTETLFETELFGHVEGAFTDSKNDRAGRFEAATSGSLFLDEIGNISFTLQSKLLTAIQNKAITKVGSNNLIPVDVRLICATNKNLDEMVTQELFREDLLFRINTITITLPPLRERGDDIIMLSDYFLKKYSQKYERGTMKITQKAFDKLMEYNWPGNIRELKHAFEKAVIMCDDNILRPNDFLLNNKPNTNQDEDVNTLADVEKITIAKVLKRTKGNLSQTAKTLDISRTTLYSKMKKYGL